MYMGIVLAIFITILFHELGHLFAAIYYKIPIEYITIGFGKPKLSFKIKNIQCYITPWLIGGEVRVRGEFTSENNGLKVRPYYQKIVTSIAGLVINLILAIIAYQIAFGNFYQGFIIDSKLYYLFFTKQQIDLFYNVPFNFWYFLGSFNFIAFILNVIPYPALDGSYFWLVLLNDKWMKKLATFGKISVLILQLLLVIWILI